ncbi:MAG: phage baseplate protein [Cyanobacteria bacterium P01_D01_bin.116]
MKVLSEVEILNIWEIGSRQHPVDRALTILRWVFPEQSRQELATLSIGERDKYLLSVREQTFGDRLYGYTECPQCSERLEFTYSTQDLQLPENSQETVLTVIIEQLEMCFRLPNSQDLAVVVSSNSMETAYQSLVTRCLLEVKRAGIAVGADNLSVEEIEQLATAIAKADPQAEILLDFDCPACGYNWQEILDIITFLWTEISVQAQRLLREVHLLASAYGWSEREILSLSPTRRQLYLELVS